MTTETHLSPSLHEKLKAELEDLTTRGRTEIARTIETARALGDLSENGDYHAAKDAQGKMEARIRQIKHMLDTAVIVDEAEAGGAIVVGSVVGITYEGDDDVERFLIGSIEESHDEAEIVSPTSPLGAALLGHREGDVVEYKVPTGATLKVTVVEVGV